MNNRRFRGCFPAVIIGLLSACGIAIGLSYLSNHLPPSHSPVTDRLGDPDKARLAEAVHLRSELGGELWPGWGDAEIPMIAYNEEYAFLVAYADPPAGWTTIPRRSARGMKWEQVPDDAFDGRTYYRQKLLSPDSSPQAFTVLIGDRWVSSMSAYDWSEIRLGEEFQAEVPTVLQEVFPYRIAGRIFLNLAGGKDWYICAMLHESFHAYAGMLHPDRLFDAETAFLANWNRYPWDDDSFVGDWQTELDVLADAVLAESNEEAAGLAGLFLSHREQRRTDAGMDADLIKMERGKEWEEGLAKYTELSIWRLAAESAGYSPLPEMAGDSGFASYAGFPAQWAQQVAQIRRMARDDGDTRFYYTGLAQAVLLDRLAPGWRQTVLTGDASLEELLEVAIG